MILMWEKINYVGIRMSLEEKYGFVGIFEEKMSQLLNMWI